MNNMKLISKKVTTDFETLQAMLELTLQIPLEFMQDCRAKSMSETELHEMLGEKFAKLLKEKENHVYLDGVSLND